MSAQLLYAFLFLLSGLLAELYYYLVCKKETPCFIRVARVIVYSSFTLLIRILMVLNGGMTSILLTDLFETVYNALYYIGLSFVLGIVMPNAYLLVEHILETIATAKKNSKDKEAA